MIYTPSRDSSVGSSRFRVPPILRRYVEEMARLPEVNLREHVIRTPPPSGNKAETSPEVQNRGLSGPAKRTHVLQKFLKKDLHYSWIVE